MVRHNNVLPNAHFRKQWDVRVRTWFSQPARKHRRREARAAKAKAVFPRPVAGSLRPVVRGQTKRYNTKVRAGRGFTLDELKAAGIPAKHAQTVGICVDHRRKNRSEESMQVNVERLKEYKGKLVLFPRRAGKPKSGDASADEMKAVTAGTRVTRGAVMPIRKAAPVIERVAVTADMKAAKAYATLRQERTNARLVGVRAKKKEEKEKEEKAAEAAGGAK